MAATKTTKRAKKTDSGSQKDQIAKLDPNEKLDISTIETWLWDAACVIRGATDAPKFKDYILPLVFYKRLSDVFDDEFEQKVQEFGDEDLAREIIAADHASALKEGRKPIVRFYIPDPYRWYKVRNHAADGSLGEFLTTIMRGDAQKGEVGIAGLNPDLQGVLDIKDFNETQSGQRILEDDRLSDLIEVISRHRLGLKNAEPDVFGQAYEYLLRKFAEGQGQSAGEFLTPPEVGWLMAEIIDPKPYSTVYDPTCGSGRLLIKARLLFERKYPELKSQAPKLFGQEQNATSYAIARMNMFLYDYGDSMLAIGDTFKNPSHSAQGAGLSRFDYAVANPMWNQDNYDEDFYNDDGWKRFEYGAPPKSSADWGWVQHIFASLKDQGKAAIVLDTGAVSRGSGSKSSNKEKEIRKAFVDRDWVEGVILLPENLFYNTTAPGVIILLNRDKPVSRKGEFLLVNASAFFVKEKPKNRLTDEGIQSVAEVYRHWQTRDKLSRVVTLAEVQEADYNLSPSQFVEIADKVVHRSIADILTDLAFAKSEREQADRGLQDVLVRLGLG
ncbi:MAG: N-6 DNA methylase [Pseudanabaena sp.]|jgi:type I restriction enzyme M protein